MNYIIGPRGSGRSSYILRQREQTGGRIYTATNMAAQALKEKALMLGYSPDDIVTLWFDKNNWRGRSYLPDEHVYFDDFNSIFKDMLAEYMNYPKGWEFIKPILAITTDEKTINLTPYPLTDVTGLICPHDTF